MRFTPESQRRFATSKYATCETTSILVLGFGGARKRRSARQDFRRIRFLLRAQVNREGIDWTEHHRRPDRYRALRITEEGFCSSWSFIAADVGPLKATRRVRLAFSVGGMSCVAPAMQAVATSVASRLFHPDGFANNPSNPQTHSREARIYLQSQKGFKRCAENVRPRKQLRLLRQQREPNATKSHSICLLLLLLLSYRRPRNENHFHSRGSLCFGDARFFLLLLQFQMVPTLKKINNGSWKWKKQSKPEYVVFQRNTNQPVVLKKATLALFFADFAASSKTRLEKWQTPPMISVILTPPASASKLPGTRSEEEGKKTKNE